MCVLCLHVPAHVWFVQHVLFLTFKFLLPKHFQGLHGLAICSFNVYVFKEGIEVIVPSMYRSCSQGFPCVTNPVLRKSKTNKFSFRRTFKFLQMYPSGAESHGRTMLSIPPFLSGSGNVFPWSEVTITHISLDVFFLPKEMPSQLVVPNTLNRLNSTDF